MSTAGKRLDNLLFKQLGFSLKRPKFNKLELPELAALLEENTAIWLQFKKEGKADEFCIKYWGNSRFKLVMLFVEAMLPKDIFKELDNELNRDMISFITEIDK